MALQLENWICCIKHWWGVYKQNSVVNGVCVDDWTAELAIIASNGLSKVTNQITLTVALALSIWVNHWSVKREKTLMLIVNYYSVMNFLYFLLI